ncbi:NlpC/P60 family protein [Actinoallomurus sp. NPDC052274]|uniref:C40 family peptidase n=1 Tax=Actinoallomurus sp. NPDC052274 TaxID=3155420 RepID=UPI00341C5239
MRITISGAAAAAAVTLLLTTPSAASAMTPAYAGAAGLSARAAQTQACADHGRNDGPAGPTGGNAQERIERVVAAATSMTGRGLSYSWGAGGKGGPSCGIADASPGGHHDYNVLGFDCSGLTLYAFWKGTGLDIGSSSSAQYRNGTKIPRDQMRRGDLIFWKTHAEHIVHVALYLGNNKIIEAAPPRGTNSVHVTDLYSSGGGDVVTDHAVRYIG